MVNGMFCKMHTSYLKYKLFVVNGQKQAKTEALGGEDEEAGEGVAGAALARNDVVVSGCLQ